MNATLTLIFLLKREEKKKKAMNFGCRHSFSVSQFLRGARRGAERRGARGVRAQKMSPSGALGHGLSSEGVHSGMRAQQATPPSPFMASATRLRTWGRSEGVQGAPRSSQLYCEGPPPPTPMAQARTHPLGIPVSQN